MPKSTPTPIDSEVEKNKWISITGLCNNHCIFCLDGGRTDKYHYSKENIKNQILKARKRGCTKLILSGGEPTIHPNIIQFVKYAKSLKFLKIQIITNGRLFSSKDFTKRIIQAGLNEVTFSIHGYNSNMHDELTSVAGSFNQTIKGVRNVQQYKNMIINTDTCVTKKNYEDLPHIIHFIVSFLKIHEVNLMTMLPIGYAWENKNRIMCPYESAAPYIREVIDYCRQNNIVLWLSRFPPEYLENYEEFINDPYKLIDDVEARIKFLKDTLNPSCKGEKCNFCILNKICGKILNINNPALRTKKKGNTSPNTVFITKNNYKKLKESIATNKKTFLKFLPPKRKLKDYEKVVPKIENVLPYLKKLDSPNIHITGIPPCILHKGNIKNIKYTIEDDIDYSRFIVNKKKDYFGLAKEIVLNLKIKKKDCEKCINYAKCEGLYANYVRIFGFQELTPIKERP